ncbi:MAG: LamG-like jellyroll fold domain-containing protein, partial [Candidatus Nanohaloarchaea archaeon]
AVPAGAAGWWRFEEPVSGTGGSVRDWSGNGNNASTAGSMDTASTGFTAQSNAFDFDATDDHVITEYSKAAASTYPDGVTVMAWVKRQGDGPSANNRIAALDCSEYWCLLDYQGNGHQAKWIVRSSSSSNYDLYGPTIPKGEWVHLAGVADPATGEVSLYMNGKQVANRSDLPDIGTGTTRYLNIGDGTEQTSPSGTQDCCYFNGKIDEVQVYHRALSGEEIRSTFVASAYTSPWFQGSRDWVDWSVTGGVPVKPAAGWSMDSGSGQTVVDGAGTLDGVRGTDSGTESSDPAWTDLCRHRNCLRFDGSDDRVTVSAGSDLGYNHTVTVTAWVQVDELDARMAVVKKQGDYRNYQFEIQSDDLAWTAQQCDGNWISTGSSLNITDRGWHFVALRHNSRTGTTFFLDNRTDFRSNPYQMCGTGSGPLYIGRGSGGGMELFNGTIDDVRVYDRALSDSAVQAIRHATSGSYGTSAMQVRARASDPRGPALVGSWSFEGTGQAVADGSGNVNHGTLGANGSDAVSDPVRVSGVSGAAAGFDGSDDYIDGPVLSGLDTGNVTVSAWVRSDGSTGSRQSVISAGEQSGTGTVLAVDDGSGSIRFWVHTSSGWNSVAAPTTYDEWMHIAGVYDG